MPLPTRANLGEVGLNVTASPVDTYVRPAAASGGGLGRQLAAALEGFQPTIRQYLKKKEDEKDSAAEGLARKQAISEGTVDLKKVQDGTLHPGQSPLWQKFYKDQTGRNVGLKMVRDARLAYEEGNFASSENPQDFETFLDGFLKENLAAVTDGDVLGGLLPSVEQERNRLILANAQVTGENQKARYLDEVATEVDSLISNEAEAAAAEGRGFNPAAVWDSINSVKNRGRFIGMSGEAVNKLVVDAATAHAERVADPGALEALKDQTWKDPKTGAAIPGPFSSTYGRAKLRDAIQRVDARRVELSNQINTIQEREKKQAQETALGDWAAAAAQGKRLNPAQLAVMTKQFGADFLTSYNSVLTSQNGVVNSDRSVRDYDDNGKLASIYTELLTGNPDPNRKAGLMASLRDPQNVSRFYDDAKQDDTGSTVFKQLRKFDGNAFILDAVANAGKDDSPMGKALGQDPDVVLRAQVGLSREISTYTQFHPELLKGNPDELQKFHEHFMKRMAAYKSWAATSPTERAAAPVGAPAPAAAAPVTPGAAPPPPSNPFTDGTTN